MKKEYYKLDLRKIHYYTLTEYIKETGECTFTRTKFIPRNLEELNYLYFKKQDDETYTEFITSNPIKLKYNKVIYPYGTSIKTKNLVPCKPEEGILAFDKLKKNDALIEYNQIIKDVLVNCNFINPKVENIMKK